MKAPSQAEETMKIRVAFELPHFYNQHLGELIGFLLGDGSISKKSNAISFVNSDIFCIKKTLKNFNIAFNLNKEAFSYYLIIPFGKNKTIAKNKWTSELKLKKDVIVYNDKNKKTKKEFGIMHVKIYNKFLHEKINAIISEIEKGKDTAPAFNIGFLKGFFAAEGAVIPGKTRKEVPNSIQFPQKNKRYLHFIKKILDGLGIESRIVIKQKRADYYCVNITAEENFRKFSEFNLADMHKEKKKKIIDGLNSYVSHKSRRNVTSIKLLKLLIMKAMNRVQIYSGMERTPQQINGMLYSTKKSFILRNHLIEKVKEGKNIYWRITDGGREFLRLSNCKHNSF